MRDSVLKSNFAMADHRQLRGEGPRRAANHRGPRPGSMQQAATRQVRTRSTFGFPMSRALTRSGRYPRARNLPTETAVLPTSSARSTDSLAPRPALLGTPARTAIREGAPSPALARHRRLRRSSDLPCRADSLNKAPGTDHADRHRCCCFMPVRSCGMYNIRTLS